MIVTIMQPYFFPYIGYFQLMHAVDVFVFYDDVQFIKGGWINRNRILVGGRLHWLTLPLKHDALSKAINQRFYVLGKTTQQVKQKLNAAYFRSHAFNDSSGFLYELLDFGNPNVAAFNMNLLRKTAEQLNLRCNFVTSSEIGVSKDLNGESRVIRLCEALGANHYINPIGGASLYDPAHFANAGLRLSFLRTACSPTRFEDGEAYLSIVDLVMREGFDGCRPQLGQYKILSKEELAGSLFSH
ncbi:MAG TPA: WbqC family protein [Rhodanobacteraceae bacterium]|jgi:hypothetical protein|nr:WbqC family protein [Rhodanobacteraceae bacterium]